MCNFIIIADLCINERGDRVDSVFGKKKLYPVYNKTSKLFNKNLTYYNLNGLSENFRESSMLIIGKLLNLFKVVRNIIYTP